MISCTFSSDNEKLKGLLTSEIERETDKILRVVAKSVFDVSQVYVPVDTGNLKFNCSGIDDTGNGYVVWYNTAGSERKGKKVNKDYAVFVENKDIPHRHGRAHFLRDAVIAVMGAINSGGVL